MTFLVKADDGKCYWVSTLTGEGTTKVVLTPAEPDSKKPAQ